MTLKSKIHLLTFGGGSPQFRAAAQRLGRQAAASDLFSEIKVVTDLDLQADDRFQAAHADFVASNPRGYGYWLWKPYLLLRMLEQVEDGAVVFFSDAGCEINPLGRSVFASYVEMVQRSGLLLFRLPYLNEHWTKGDLLNSYPALVGRGQMMATFMGTLSGGAGRAFVQSWYDLCCGDEYHNLDDTPSLAANHPGFVEHRHDQACLSAVALSVSEAKVLPAGRDLGKGRDMIHQPFLILRNRTGAAKIRTGSLLGVSFLVNFKRRPIPKIIIARRRS
jgi:hypothetical protein